MAIPRHWDTRSLDERVSLCSWARDLRARTSFFVCVISPTILMLVVGDIVGQRGCIARSRSDIDQSLSSHYRIYPTRMTYTSELYAESGRPPY